MIYFPTIPDIKKAASNIKQITDITPLSHNIRLSKQYGADIFLKREDLHRVRSYKIRGAYNKISSLSKEERECGVVCASAGNHAQGVAYACSHLGINASIFMPMVTPTQKVEQTKMFGGPWVKVILEGDTFDDSFEAADAYSKKNKLTLIHPFDDPKII